MGEGREGVVTVADRCAVILLTVKNRKEVGECFKSFKVSGNMCLGKQKYKPKCVTPNVSGSKQHVCCPLVPGL